MAGVTPSQSAAVRPADGLPGVRPFDQTDMLKPKLIAVLVLAVVLLLAVLQDRHLL